MRHDHHRNVHLYLDGDAQAWVWTPNITDPAARLEIDLLPIGLAGLVHMGRGADYPEATRTNGGVTLMCQVDLGVHGYAEIAGHAVSEDAVARLAAIGFVEAVRAGRNWQAEREPDPDDPETDPEPEPNEASNPEPEPDTEPGTDPG